MKRRNWIKILKRNGWYLERNGSNHDIYTNGKESESVSRQSEIDDNLIKSIMSRRGLK